jgi:HTH-type transcriptional regulator/antitoxin HipB
MNMDYTIHTAQQLAQTLRGQRKTRQLTQKALSDLVGLLPKTVSALESAPANSSIASLFKALSALDLELVLRPKTSAKSTANW